MLYPTPAVAPARGAAAWGPTFHSAVAAALFALALATRWPLANLSWGEADSARYLIGVWQWLRLGPQAPDIYAKVLSPGYYALAVWLVHHTGVRPETLLCQLSLWSAAASAPLLYWIGARLTSGRAAAAGTAVFLLSPAYWWLGLEAHPQNASFLCLLLAMVFFLAAAGRRQWWAWWLAASIWLGLGMLLKSDAIVFALVFPALAKRFGASWRRAAAALAIPAGAVALFYPVRQAVLGVPWGAAQHQTVAVVWEFLSLPHGAEWIKQLLPILTAPGVAVFALMVVALGWAWRDGTAVGRTWRRRWGWLLASWAGAELLFWLLLRGNNARHMAAYSLLPLWAALEWVELHCPERQRPRRAWAMGALCLIAVGLDLVLVPASSNLTLYPSGNVVASQRDLARRTAELRAWLAASLQIMPAGGNVYLGNATLPYMELALLEAGPHRALARAGVDASRLPLPDGAAEFIEVNSGGEFAAAARGYPAVFSLEYTPAGLHRQFLGGELPPLPLLARWYPGGRLR